MTSSAAPRSKISPVVLAAVSVVLAGVIIVAIYFSRPGAQKSTQISPQEKQAFASKVKFSDVTVKAAENLMQQQVVYVDGTLTNTGQRPVQEVFVDCKFSGIEGNTVYTERASVLQSKPSAALAPGQTRRFEVPFDNVPESWNQGPPKLEIVRIRFGQ